MESAFEPSSCLTEQNFNLVSDYISKFGIDKNMSFSEDIQKAEAAVRKLSLRNWDVTYTPDPDMNWLRFSRTGKNLTLGYIANNQGKIKLAGLSKSLRQNSKREEEIGNVFCSLAVFLQNKESILTADNFQYLVNHVKANGKLEKNASGMSSLAVTVADWKIKLWDLNQNAHLAFEPVLPDFVWLEECKNSLVALKNKNELWWLSGYTHPIYDFRANFKMQMAFYEVLKSIDSK